eukprot:2550579-Amphidinium_carterae.1
MYPNAHQLAKNFDDFVSLGICSENSCNPLSSAASCESKSSPPDRKMFASRRREQQSKQASKT